MDYKVSIKGEHYNVIVEATWEKVRQNPKVKEIILQTGDLRLRPDHKQAADTPPAWKYYEIYMEIRDQLRKEKNVYSMKNIEPSCKSANRLSVGQDLTPKCVSFP